MARVPAQVPLPAAAQRARSEPELPVHWAPESPARELPEQSQRAEPGQPAAQRRSSCGGAPGAARTRMVAAGRRRLPGPTRMITPGRRPRMVGPGRRRRRRLVTCRWRRRQSRRRRIIGNKARATGETRCAVDAGVRIEWPANARSGIAPRTRAFDVVGSRGRARRIGGVVRAEVRREWRVNGRHSPECQRGVVHAVGTERETDHHGSRARRPCD